MLNNHNSLNYYINSNRKNIKEIEENIISKEKLVRWDEENITNNKKDICNQIYNDYKNACNKINKIESINIFYRPINDTTWYKYYKDLINNLPLDITGHKELLKILGDLKLFKQILSIEHLSNNSLKKIDDNYDICLSKRIEMKYRCYKGDQRKTIESQKHDGEILHILFYKQRYNELKQLFKEIKQKYLKIKGTTMKFIAECDKIVGSDDDDLKSYVSTCSSNSFEHVLSKKMKRGRPKQKKNH